MPTVATTTTASGTSERPRVMRSMTIPTTTAKTGMTMSAAIGQGTRYVTWSE